MDPGVFQPRTMRNTGCPYFRLFHPDLADGKGHVDNLVNSAVKRGEADGLTVSRVDFYYHVKVSCSDPELPSVFLRCHPMWNQRDSETGLPASDWFDWVEVNWETGDGLNAYTVPAILVLWGNVIYSDDSTVLLASVCSLQSTKAMSRHDRMFFASGDNLVDGPSSFCVVDFDSILSTAFVVPAIPPGHAKHHKSPAESLKVLEDTNYYVALPPRCSWKNIGWDRLTSLEQSGSK